MKLAHLALALASTFLPADARSADARSAVDEDAQLAARLVEAAATAVTAPGLEVSAWFAAVGEGASWSLYPEREFVAPKDPPPWIAQTLDDAGRVSVQRVAAALREALATEAPFEETRLWTARHALMGTSRTVRLTGSRRSWLATGRWVHEDAAFDYVVIVGLSDAAGVDTPHGWRALEAVEEELVHAARVACGLPAVELYRFGQPFLPSAPDEAPRSVVPVGDGRWPGAFSRFAIGALPGHTVADIGCGSGGAAKALAKALGPTSRVLARDLVPQPVLLASRSDNLEYVQSTKDDVAIAPRTLDRAYMEMVLHYVLRQESTQDAFAASLFRAMKPGGRVFVIQHESSSRTRDQETAAGVELFARAGFEVGPRWRIHDGWDGRRMYLVLEFRRPLDQEH